VHQGLSGAGLRSGAALIAGVDLSTYRTITKTGGAHVDTSIHLKFDTDETVSVHLPPGGSPWWSAPISPRVGSNTLFPDAGIARIIARADFAERSGVSGRDPSVRDFDIVFAHEIEFVAPAVLMILTAG
jgi:hypothetical protein